MPAEFAPFVGLAMIPVLIGAGILLVLVGLRMAKPTPRGGWQPRLLWKGQGRELRRK